MTLTSELHLAAGVAAVGLGVAALRHAPRRAENRTFAALCGALAIWNLGVTGHGSLPGPDLAWHRTFLLGSCAAAPLALLLALQLAGVAPARRRWPAAAASVAAAALWLSAWTSAYSQRDRWNLTATALLGCILIAGIAALLVRIGALPPGRERRALGLLVAGGLVATAAGLSDFLPRGVVAVPKIGPAGVLLFLLVVCAIVVRDRFLDVDVFLARALALLIGAAGAALCLLGVVRLTGPRFFPLLAASVALILAGPAARRLLLSGARSLLGADDSAPRALLEVSRRLPAARSSDEVWEAIEAGQRGLRGDVEVDVFLRSESGERFERLPRPAAARGEAEAAPAIPAASALPALLARRRLPLTRRILEQEARAGDAEGRALAAAARAEIDRLRFDLVTPLARGAEILGWLGVRGVPDRVLGADLAAAFQGVGSQAVESLERIDASERALRREALAAAGELAAGLAHEVRNPLAALRGAAQVLAGESDPARVREMLAVIDEESDRLGRVVGEFLDYARPASARREPVDAAEQVRRALRAAEAAGRALATEVRIAPGTPPLLGDPDALRRAFANLIDNARDAAGPGGRLRIEIGAAGGRVVVRFEDDGPGIPPEEIARLFTPFRTRKPGGTGLGLALVQRVAEAHGGEVAAERGRERGAAFTLSIPAAAAAPGPQETSA